MSTGLPKQSEYQVHVSIEETLSGNVQSLIDAIHQIEGDYEQDVMWNGYEQFVDEAADGVKTITAKIPTLDEQTSQQIADHLSSRFDELGSTGTVKVREFNDQGEFTGNVVSNNDV
jgi:hypothetical protein